MLPDRVSNPGPLTYESGALPIALSGPATRDETNLSVIGSLSFCSLHLEHGNSIIPGYLKPDLFKKCSASKEE